MNEKTKYVKALCYVTDEGDWSVGILPMQWTVECPFYNDETDYELIEFFRKRIVDLYSEFSEGKITAEFCFELNYKNQ